MRPSDAAVKLSRRYIPDRQLPDKAVSLLDTTCARVAISQHAVPPEVDDCRKRIGCLETELQIIVRESSLIEECSGREATVKEALGKRAAEAPTVGGALVIRAGTGKDKYWKYAPGCGN